MPYDACTGVLSPVQADSRSEELLRRAQVKAVIDWDLVLNKNVRDLFKVTAKHLSSKSNY